MIFGLAVIYESPATIHRRGIRLEERIAAGAFRRSVEAGKASNGKPIMACLDHDSGRVLGSTAGSLRLLDTPRGLYFELDRDDVREEEISGVSVSFKPLEWRRIGPSAFRLVEADLRHIAILRKRTPAYKQTWALEI